MKPLAVAFLWHMHQPMYRDPLSRKVLMPWVRMHSIKGYNDMIRLAQEYPQVKQNFNVVPSLIAQIEDFLKAPSEDNHWALSSKPAGDLNVEERKLVVDEFFMANWDTMIKPYPRYWELLGKCGQGEPDVSAFSEADLRDLQVWFNLTWFGYMARRDYPVLGELIRKGRHFSEDDKKTVMETQRKVMQELMPAYKKAQDAGIVEISVSPFYHPILPLLMDTDFAQRAMPWVRLPSRFRHPEDAAAQIQKALDKAEKVFGRRPIGMWPSEGSVCEELVEIMAQAGVQWIATDEEVLIHSMEVLDRGKALYRPYRAKHKGGAVNIVFRDHALSDLIGFVYSKSDAAGSAGDMIGHFTRIGQYLGDAASNGLVSVILDGENPWEYYPDGGEKFLRCLFEQLSRHQGLRSVTLGAFLEDHPPKHEIDHLYSGSWIAHNYDIWIGEREENTAWDLMGRTRDFLCEYLKRNPQTAKEKSAAAWEELYMAEGSDWFWWYGDDFSTENDAMFDTLFRTHLANVYRLLGCEVPEILHVPIIQQHPEAAAADPVGFISPVLDGQVTHFYEWQEGGYLQAAKSGSTMARADSVLQGLHYGFDLHHLYLRLDMLGLAATRSKRDFVMTLHFVQPPEYKLVFAWTPQQKPVRMELQKSEDGTRFIKVKELSSLRIQKVAELSLPFADLKVKKGDALQFFVQVQEGQLMLERVPREGYLSLTVPDEEFESKMWSV